MNALWRLDAVWEFARFAVVGLVSNAVLFLLYLVMTSVGVGPKVSATVAYAIGVLQTFVFNRSWSFRHLASAGPAFVRYVLLYSGGYVANMLILAVFVDRAGYRHQWVQGITILALAVIFFVLLKFWVFREKARAR